MFEESIRLFDEYYRAQEPNSAFNTRAGVEFRRRLQQLDYFLSEVRARDGALAGRTQSITGRMLVAKAALEERGLTWEDKWPADIQSAFDAPLDEPVDVEQLPFEIETLAEAFYFFTGRIRELLRKDKGGNRTLPGLGELPHTGAVRVRDMLVEHYRPDGEAPRGLGAHFATGDPQGPVLRLEQGEEIDAGLYVNAEQLAAHLEAKLRAATRQPGR
ncbi:MAG: hypothetical protein JF603_10065 [Acidobacteria bacterium]|nr:hypothetical protein [Acidobacteriota bacterium]